MVPSHCPGFFHNSVLFRTNTQILVDGFTVTTVFFFQCLYPGFQFFVALIYLPLSLPP